jgi:hypothetical protein
MAGILSLLEVVLLAAQTGITSAGEWSFTKIDNCPYTAQYFGSAVRLDSGGRPQVLFQRDPNHGSGLAHARIEGDTWKIQTIAHQGSVLSMRFVLGGNDLPHVLYSVFNRKDEGLKYASTDDMKWKEAAVYGKPTPSEDEMMRRFGCNRYSLDLMVSDSNDLAVDKDAGVHVVYADPESERVVYGYRPPKAREWAWEPLEEVGNHRLTVSRIEPVVRVSPDGEVWVVYKRYTEGKTDVGVRTVRIELRLAVKTGREWKYSTIADGLGFIDGQSQILFGTGGECLVAYTRCAAKRYGDPSTRWLLVQLSEGQWVQRYDGAPRGQLLAAAWVGDRFEMLMTDVRPDRPDDGTTLQDTIVRLSTAADWKWKTENLLELKDKRALSAAMNRYGDTHVLFASSSATSSTLECGILKAAEADRQQAAPADADKPRR